MSAGGYLQRLVARQTAPLAVRPRTPPRFAPEPVERVAQQRVTPPRPAAIGREQPSPVAPDMPPAMATTPDAARTVERQADEPGVERLVPGQSRVLDADAGAPSLAILREIESPPVGGQFPRDSPSAVDGQRDTTIPDAPIVLAERGHSDRRAPIVPRRPAEPAAAPSRGRRDRRDSDVQGDEPDTIHVHIGRVEVRAIVPAAEQTRPPAVRQPAPQPLSLDDYLARRSRR